MYYPSSIILVSSQVVGYKGKKGQVILVTPAQLTFPFVELFLNRCIFQDLIVIAIKAGPNILLFPDQIFYISAKLSSLFSFYITFADQQLQPLSKIFPLFFCSFGPKIFILRVVLFFWQVHLILIVYYAIFCILYP